MALQPAPKRTSHASVLVLRLAVGAEQTEAKCAVCKTDLPRTPGTVMLSLPDGRSLVLHACVTHLSTAHRWMAQWLDSGRIKVAPRA